MESQQNRTGPASGNLDKTQKESLISMIALLYIEDQHLLNPEQLDDAKASLRALILRTTGEETMLLKLIEILKTNKALNQGFSDISSVLVGIGKSSETIKRKIGTFKAQLSSLGISPEENTDFIGPFLEFSGDFINNVEQFERLIIRYRDEREQEARYAHMFRIAKEARRRLKQRLSGALGGEEDDDRESEIKEKMIHAFDYGETEIKLNHSQREARDTLSDIESLLDEFREMCQLAMNPNMREQEKGYQPFRQSKYDDIFTLFIETQTRHPRLEMIKAPIQDLLRLFQHSYGMFMLDFQKFDHAITPMSENTEAYFQAKDEDEDIRTKREKLEKIEGLISFLETASGLLTIGDETNYTKFSRAISDIITRTASNWNHISEDLLRMKVAAEADLSTRLS